MERRMFFATLFFAFTAQTAEPDLSPLDERLQETRLRLALTEEQMTEVRPILQDHFDAQMTILDKYDIGNGKRPKLRKLRALRQDLKANKAQTTKRLAAILSAEQTAEFDKIQAEQKERTREKFRSDP